MATGKLFSSQEKPGGYNINPAAGSDHHFEFDEADIWNLNDAIGLAEPKKPLPISKLSRRLSRIKVDPSGGRRGAVVASASLPVNVPDWPKILKEEYRKRESDEDLEEDGVDDDGEDGRVPPHEYLARRRGASLSVHEGVGRTLKGMDLRRVRNAIWQKTGFED